MDTNIIVGGDCPVPKAVLRKLNTITILVKQVHTIIIDGSRDSSAKVPIIDTRSRDHGVSFGLTDIGSALNTPIKHINTIYVWMKSLAYIRILLI